MELPEFTQGYSFSLHAEVAEVLQGTQGKSRAEMIWTRFGAHPEDACLRCLARIDGWEAVLP